MIRRLFLAVVCAWAATSFAQAQVAFSNHALPSRTALDRTGLERNWVGVVPLDRSERVISISLAEDLVFVQTNQANFHAYQAETGRYLWGTNLGRGSLAAQPASVNSDRVFVTNFRTLYCLDRATGHTVWEVMLETLPASPTGADEEYAFIGLTSGKLVSYTVRDHSKDKEPGFSPGTNILNWKTPNKITGRPIPANKVVAFGSQDGRAYVVQIKPPTIILRFLTAGPVSASMGTLGTRTLLVPSQDRNVYAVDLYTGETKWIYSSGDPIEQEPLVSGQDIFVQNETGRLSSLNAETGEAKWELNTTRAQLLAISPKRIYGRSLDGDLGVVDRASGKAIFLPRDTFERSGLNLRPFTLALTNRYNDRLYLASPAGLLFCLRESGALTPVLLRDPSKEEPFGFLPDDGEPITPPESPPADAPDAADAPANP